ncbi:MAG: HNH endonuclease [Nitrososphaerota archaeon]|nr:HNH endonuclease [Nitrososphaerota archaeon]
MSRLWPDVPIDVMEVDCIHPQARGGPDRPHNLRLLCPPCNRSKGSKVVRTKTQTNPLNWNLPNWNLPK